MNSESQNSSNLPRLDNYENPQHLAYGGMAELFLALQVGANGFRRQVVLKRILPQFSSDSNFVDMFLNEARIASKLSHPNIVRCYEVLESESRPVMVMEYVHGSTVRELMVALYRKKERLFFGQVVRIVAAVCDALDYAYNGRGPDLIPRRVIHRDVTPTNVLVSLDGDIKLTDFGIAKAMQSDIATRTATLKGKCSYMAPEVVLGEPMDHRADIFSAGVMLFELTTGKRLFRRETDMATMQAILRHEVPDPSSIVKGYPPKLQEILLKALERRPEDRYTSAGQLGSDLQECALREGWSTERVDLEDLMLRLFPERKNAPTLQRNQQSQSHSNPPDLRALNTINPRPASEGAASNPSGPTRRS
ncbi:MAG: serine/threonine-protein kinase, partial [Myxococcota bacterium]